MNTILQKNDLWKDIGQVKYKYSKKAKYIRIVINHDSQVSVVIPSRYSIRDAIEFVHLKKNWIQKNKIRIAHKKKLKMTLPNVELEKFWNNTKRKMVLLANIHLLDFYKLTFKTLKTRWGSCSHNNTICINNMVYYLPNHLKEYIMLHELTHTKVKNHSNIFWEELKKICPGYKINRRELKNNYTIG